MFGQFLTLHGLEPVSTARSYLAVEHVSLSTYFGRLYQFRELQFCWICVTGVAVQKNILRSCGDVCTIKNFMFILSVTLMPWNYHWTNSAENLDGTRKLENTRLSKNKVPLIRIVTTIHLLFCPWLVSQSGSSSQGDTNDAADRLSRKRNNPRGIQHNYPVEFIDPMCNMSNKAGTQVGCDLLKTDLWHLCLNSWNLACVATRRSRKYQPFCQSLEMKICDCSWGFSSINCITWCQLEWVNIQDWG